MDLQSEKRELLNALEACLVSADALGLGMVGIHVSYAIDLLRAEGLMTKGPPTKVG